MSVIVADRDIDYIGMVGLWLLKHGWWRRWRRWSGEVLKLRKQNRRSLLFFFRDDDDVLIHVAVERLIDAGDLGLLDVRQ